MPDGPIKKLLTIRKLRRDYGLSLFDVARTAKAAGVGKDSDVQESVAAIASVLIADGSLKTKVEAVGEFDWEEFFQGLIELLEVLLPLIIEIILLFL